MFVKLWKKSVIVAIVIISPILELWSLLTASLLCGHLLLINEPKNDASVSTTDKEYVVYFCQNTKRLLRFHV